MHKIVTPVSHLFFNKKNAEEISKNSDYLEIRYRTINLNFKNEKFFHIDEDLTLPWSKNFKIKFEQIIKKKKSLKYITFKSTRCCANEKLYNKMFVLSGKKFSRREMFDEAKKKYLMVATKIWEQFFYWPGKQ